MSAKLFRAKDVQFIVEIEPTAGAGDFTGSYKPIGKATEVSISASRGSVETTTKDSGNYKGKDYDLGELSGSVNGLMFYEASTIGYTELLNAQIAGKKIKGYFITVNESNAPLNPATAIATADVDGDTFLTGSTSILVTAVITSIELSAGTEGKPTYSMSFDVDGAPTVGTIAAGA